MAAAAAALQVYQPSRFRSAEQWVELVRHGLLDGVIVSFFSLARPLPADEEPAWEGIAVPGLD